MDSQGPGVKVRGNASTIYEKYTALARDAKMGGSRVNAENLMQHAEHYLRLMNEQEAAKREAQEAREKAEAERAAARRAEGDEGSDESRNSSSRNSSHRDRNQKSATEETSETPSELVETKTETTKADVETQAKNDIEDAPKRRRKAPSRKSEESVEAAE